jgi:4-oxalocrotonate tautomerase
MPHIIVKLYPGRSEEQKRQLTEKIIADAMETLKCEEKTLSVAFEEVTPEDWPEKVYRPDILDRKELLYKEPGYNPFD